MIYDVDILNRTITIQWMQSKLKSDKVTTISITDWLAGINIILVIISLRSLNIFIAELISSGWHSYPLWKGVA